MCFVPEALDKEHNVKVLISLLMKILSVISGDIYVRSLYETKPFKNRSTNYKLSLKTNEKSGIVKGVKCSQEVQQYQGSRFAS